MEKQLKEAARAVLAFMSAVAAYFVVQSLGGALLALAGLPFWIGSLVALAAAVAAGRFVWLRSGALPAGLAASIGLGALALGGIGFLGGFFGPMLFMPQANQGPLLGIFITGPLGFLIGAVLGALYWWVARGGRTGNG